MASQTGMFNALFLSPDQALYPQHETQSTQPGLPLKAEVVCFAGTMVAYDPATELAFPADPAMPRTARVVGVTEDTIDNRAGEDGDLSVNPRAGVIRLMNNGLTTEHLYTQVNVEDDHTVGPRNSDDTDRFGGLLVGVEGAYAWVLIMHPRFAGPYLAELTAATVATADATNEASAVTLANALKAELNKLITDVGEISAALEAHQLITTTAD